MVYLTQCCEEELALAGRSGTPIDAMGTGEKIRPTTTGFDGRRDCALDLKKHLVGCAPA